MNENKKSIVSAISDICGMLSFINGILEKSCDDEFHPDVAKDYPFDVEISEISCMFSAWKDSMKESM